MAAQRHGGGHARVAIAAVAAVGAALAAATGCAHDRSAGASDNPAHGAASSGASSLSVLAASSPGALVRGAADVLTKSGSSQARTQMVMTSGGTRVAVDGAGAFDYRERAGELVVRLPEGASGESPDRRRRVTEVFISGALYMKNRGAGVPPDKWVRVDTTSVSDGNLLTGGATDPVSAAELLRGARKVTYAGRSTVRGARVLRYRGTVDIAAAARDASPSWHAQLAAAAKGFAKRTVPFDAYIDGQGRLRKIRHQFTFAAGVRGEPGATEPDSDGGRMAVASTTWLYGFGAPVTVGLPESGDIYAGKIAPS
jgi:hypothetical protein